MNYIKEFEGVVKFIYSYYGTPIPKSRFIENVPEDWMDNIDSESDAYSHGGYKAQLIEEIKVNKSDFEVVEFMGGYFGICKYSTGGQCVYGGDSAFADHYNKDFIQEVYDDWDGTLRWEGSNYGFKIDY